MATSCSPLRYPGGKQILARVLGHLIEVNKCEGGVYAEAYAGGAGAALSLLFAERVERLMLNDADLSIYSFWQAVLRKTDAFLKLLRDTPVSVTEWHRQRNIYLHPSRHSSLRLGFATFYLNRCNRSGIIGNAGLIGGLEQRGKWKLDARFNRDELATRIRRAALYSDRIDLFNLDATDFLRNHVSKANMASRSFAYLDPPYFAKGSQLYLNSYRPEDHRNLARYLKQEAKFLWVMSYDDVPEIRALYRDFRQVAFDLGYSARDRRVGKELLIFKKSIAFPQRWKSRIPSCYITAAAGIRVPLSG
jgi:DNA adenine methylase